MIDYVGIASQMIVVGVGMECVFIIIGYIVSTVFNLLKVR